MSVKKGMQSDLLTSGKTIKTFDNEPSEQSITTDRSLTIGKLGIFSLRLELKLMNTPGKAAGETAAEGAIISDNLGNKLKTKPPTLRHAVVNTAGKGMKIDTLLWDQ